MWEYTNGTYNVKILEDGTKIREGEEFIPEFPESLDVKITNECDGNCPFCHENSTPDGKHADADFCVQLLRQLPGGVELALGGGNVLSRPKDLEYLLRKLPYRVIKNITINAKHLSMFPKYVDVQAIGISYSAQLHDKIKEFVDANEQYHQIVIHLIAGVHTLDDLNKCLTDFKRVLILGYKNVGRGKTFLSDNVNHELATWEKRIVKYLADESKTNIVVFDNLAIKQLRINRFFTTDRWNEIYMGDDGQFTMYLDLVEKKYAVSSRSLDKYDIENKTIKEMFAYVREISGNK
jgi:hypothetical protein